jgi:hypothetical protein
MRNNHEENINCASIDFIAETSNPTEWLDDWAEAVEMCQNPNVLEILSANLLSQRVIARA